MKTKLLLLIVALLFIQSKSIGQNDIITAGDHLISVSAGVLNPESFAFDILGFSGSGDPSPSLNLHYQYSLSDRIAIGGYGSFYRVDASYVNSIGNLISDFNIDAIDDLIGNLACNLLGTCEDAKATERVSVFTLGGTLTYHTPLTDEIDTYATTYLGYSFNRRKSFTAEIIDVIADQSGLGVRVPNVVYFTGVGARYFVKPQIALYGEAGYGNSHIIHVGLSYKLSSNNGDTARVRTK